MRLFDINDDVQNYKQAYTPYLENVFRIISETHNRCAQLTYSLNVHVPPKNSLILKRRLVCGVNVLWNSYSHDAKLRDDSNISKACIKI